MHGAFINQSMQTKVLKRVKDILTLLEANDNLRDNEDSLPQIDSSSAPKPVMSKDSKDQLDSIKSYLLGIINQTIDKIEQVKQEKKKPMPEKKPIQKSVEEVKKETKAIKDQIGRKRSYADKSSL
jgi:uncharacterized protein (UPF0335 family)